MDKLYQTINCKTRKKCVQNSELFRISKRRRIAIKPIFNTRFDVPTHAA